LNASDLTQIWNPEKLRDNKVNRIAYLTKKIKQNIHHILFADSSGFIQVISRRSMPAGPARIGFYLDNPLFVHLGDQLFFEPALRLTKNNFDTYISPTPDMSEYFIKSGAKVINDSEIFNCDIIVTREELLHDVLSKTKADIIAINTLANDMGYRISESITYGLAHIFKIEIPENFDFAPWKPSVSQKRVAPEKVILAPFVNSGWFRVWKSDVKQLSLQAKKCAEECGLSLCLVGGEADTESRIPAVIGTCLEDWRGRFSPYQFAQILASGKIARVFTFDTFVFHAALAYEIPVTVKIRRSLPKRMQFIKEHFLPSYSSANHQIEFL